MKLLGQFGIIMFVTFLGEVLHQLLPLPVPAGIYGLLLLLLLLCLRVLRLEQVRGAASFLLEIMPLLFLPASVGLMAVWPELRLVLLPVVVITVVTTVAVMAVTGRTAQALLRKGRGPKRDA